MLASIGSAVAIQAAVMLDAIIVANFIGPDAMSAINVCTPVVAILVNVGYMVSMGATLLISKAIGDNNMLRGSHVAGVAIALLSAIGVVLAVSGWLLSDTLVALICSDESIAGYAKIYLGLFFLLDLLPLFVYNAVCGFTEADGSPHVVTRSVIIGGLVNLVLDLLFVGVFHWGIAGAMYATIVNNLVVIALLSRHLFRHSSLRCHLPPVGFMQTAREIISEGIPLTVGEVALMTGLMALNSLIIFTLGSSGMYIWSVCMEIFTLVLIAMSGVETSMVSIGGFLTGDDDTTGLRLLVRRALRIVSAMLLVLTLLILIVPQGIAMAFGARGDSVDTLSQALRIFSLSLVPIGVINVMRVVFQLVGRRFASGALFTCQMLFIVIVIGAMALFFPAVAWWGFPLSSVLMLAMMLAYTLYHHHRNRQLSPFTLIPLRSHDPSLSLSVPYQAEALAESLQRIRRFASGIPAIQSRVNDIMLTCEEIMKNIVEHSQGDVLRWSFDVHLHYTDGQVTFVIQDAGPAFNPLEHLPQCALDPDRPQLGIRIMSSACENLSYKRMWRQNILLGSFRADD